MKTTDAYDDVKALADAVCDGDISQAQVAQLEERLKGDAQAQKFYYEYIAMHVNLSNQLNPQQELVYRRVSEELILRPTTEKPSQKWQKEIDSNDDGHINEIIQNPPKPPQRPHEINSVTAPPHKRHWFAAFILFLAVLIWQFWDQDKSGYIGQITNGTITVIELGQLENQYVFPGQYRAEQEVDLTLANGDSLKFSAGSNFKVFNANEFELTSGAIVLTSATEQNLVFHTKSFSVYSNGDHLAIDLTDTDPKVLSGESTVLLPKRWRPKHYWSFEGKSDRTLDSAGTAHGVPEKGASRVKGLLGSGAYQFDNSASARVDVGSGGGTAPATGTFSVQDGVTIEALIRPNFSGTRGEIDEIFRKDQYDREYRMLLSFQNDRGKSYLRPDQHYKESLSFGLYLVGQGYHELKLALDGKEGRPSLAQLQAGNTHHVVATYNVNTGLKAIYIDGQMHASYQYPPGSKMLSGGSGKASIGNTPNRTRWELEAFDGVIDEMAFYDFALPSFMVKHHGKNISNGVNYYGLPPSDNLLPEYLKLPLPANHLLTIDPVSGLPIDGAEKINR